MKELNTKDILLALEIVFINHSINEIESNGSLILEAFKIKKSEDIEILIKREDYRIIYDCFIRIKKKVEAVDFRIDLKKAFLLLEENPNIEYSENAELNPNQIVFNLIRTIVKENDSAIANEFGKRNKIIKEIENGDWHDAFISYTNKGRQALNEDYQILIQRWLELDQPAFDLQKSKSNLLANTLKKYLTNKHKITSFFDRQETNSILGSNLHNVIDSNCKKSISFIQFIRNETFISNENDGFHWCKIENESFDKNHPLYEYNCKCDMKVIYIELESLNESVIKEHKEWSQDIIKKGTIQFFKTKTLNELEEEFSRIGGAINESKKQIIKKLKAQA